MSVQFLFKMNDKCYYKIKADCKKTNNTNTSVKLINWN